ncbi:MAG: class I SAM-dependent methyltransferase [Cyanobacteria bacterium]|nr:class I SAM-dependent methyltransferase [Cyanobacteriota bacterium]
MQDKNSFKQIGAKKSGPSSGLPGGLKRFIPIPLQSLLGLASQHKIDPDLAHALQERHVSPGTLLDIGTGMGQQAIELAKINFLVTGIDENPKQIYLAQQNSLSQGVTLPFLQRNILDIQMSKTFDYLLDYGCFHSLSPQNRSLYLQSVCSHIRQEGLFFLKCYSYQEENIPPGGHAFSWQDIENLFSQDFLIHDIKETQFYLPNKPWPKALFVVLEKL